MDRDYGGDGYRQIKSQIIDNDFHPVDSGLEAEQDHWGTVVDPDEQSQKNSDLRTHSVRSVLGKIQRDNKARY